MEQLWRAEHKKLLAVKGAMGTTLDVANKELHSRLRGFAAKE